MDLIRVATLNIWNKSGPWAQRLGLIRREIAELCPDVLGLQEALRLQPEARTFAPTPENDQATEIARGLGYECAYGAASDYGNGLLFGNALLSRHPILESRNIALPGLESGESRALLYARVDTPMGQLPVFVTHLNWKLDHGQVRRRQVAFIAERILELAPRDSGALPALLMGDFNAAPDSDEIRFLTGLSAIDDKTVYFADAWQYAGTGPGYTFDRENAFALVAREPSRRIDYIFVLGPDQRLLGEPMTASLAFHRSEMQDGRAIWPSDHYGVTAELAATPRPV